MSANKNFRARIRWRARLVLVTFLPAVITVAAIAYGVLTVEGPSIILAELFVVIAFFAGYGMALLKIDNTDGVLARAGDKELMNWKVLIDQELEWRQDRDERNDPISPEDVASAIEE